MDPSTPALSSSSSSTPTTIITTAQSGAVLFPSHDESKKMSIEDAFFLLYAETMELERQLDEDCRMAIAFNCDFLARAQAFHARQNRIVNRPCKKRRQKWKVGATVSSLPSPLPTNNLEEAPPAHAPPVKRCRQMEYC